MPRPRLTSDDVILQATHAEFMQHGNRATTAAIAARAGISEAGLLKRFGSKERLLTRAMGYFVQHRAVFPSIPGPPLTQEALIRLGGEILSFFRQIIPMAVMVHAHLAAHAVSEMGPTPPPLMFRARVTDYFTEAVARGEIQVENPRVLSGMFTGTLWQAAFFEHAFADQELLSGGEVEFLRTFISTLWQGILPNNQAATVQQNANHARSSADVAALKAARPRSQPPQQPAATHARASRAESALQGGTRKVTSKAQSRDVVVAARKHRKSSE